MDTTRSSRTRIPLIGWAASCSVMLAACASAPPVEAPAALQPGAGESLAFSVAARGVQIYQCRASQNAAAGYEWAFVAPDAELFDAHDRLVGRHGAGPFWQAGDGSRIVGTVKARADAPAAGAIPWLLLSAKSSGAEGSLSKVTSIQRVNTAGGVAPTAPCTRDTIDATARVAYTADYRFFTGKE